MKNIVIICGGKSAEHEISIVSASNIYNAIDKTKFKPFVITISRTGNWYLLNSNISLDTFKECNEPFDKGSLCSLMRQPNQTVLFTVDNKIINIDVAFPVMHGPMGEDGTLQGLLEMMNIPYTGGGVLASAICMDKDIMRQIFAKKNLPIIPYYAFTNINNIPTYQQMQKQLDSEILFVKPALMGSSVGVYKVKSEAEYQNALEQSFKYSMKILIDRYIPCVELECSILGNENPQVSSIGCIVPNHEFYSYEAKYIDPNGADLIIPADVSTTVSEQVRNIARDAFTAVGCMGFARADFFLSDDNKVYINELNTIPGFTSISMYPKLWLYDGMNYTSLISNIINLAVELFQRKQKIHLFPEFLEDTSINLSH